MNYSSSRGNCCTRPSNQQVPGQHVRQHQQQPHMQKDLQQPQGMTPTQHLSQAVDQSKQDSIPAGNQEQVGSEAETNSSDSSEGIELLDDEDEDEEEDEGQDDDGELCTSVDGGDELPLIDSPAWTPDHTFKVLLVGDSGVGKTCLVMRFIADKFEAQLPSTVGVDFAIKRMVVGDTNIKLTIWDTAGQERFRALTSTFYRGAVGIIFVYDVTRRETLTSLSGSWMQELKSYEPHPEVACMVVANKVDQHEQREVTWQEGADFAKQHGCLFVETSAKHNIAVGVAFEELVLRILDTPALLAAVQAEEQKGSSVNLTAARPPASGMAVSCSC